MILNEKEYNKIARSDCFICKIVQGNPLMPEPQIVYEDDKVISFLTQLPTQEGYTLVCPKIHIERFEDMDDEEWMYLQRISKKIAKAVAKATGAIRMYMASVGSPERNPHIHIHICPCPYGTPFAKQQFVAMQKVDDKYLDIPLKKMREIADRIRNNFDGLTR